jgi:hypothetical protein
MLTKEKLFTGLVVLMLGFTLVSCSQATEGREDDSDEQTEVESVVEESDIKVSEFPASNAFEDATLLGGKYKNGKFFFEVENYELGRQTDDAEVKMCANSAKGQHIHLIVDDKPYAAKYVNEFEHEVEDGEHYVLAFLSRSYHESIKSNSSYQAKKMNFENGNVTASSEIDEPILFYSRPKGTYVGKANIEKVMLDFFVLNTNMGTDHFVKAEINGEKEILLDTWAPIFLEGLPIGDNKIKLTLVDKEGVAVDAPNNPVERVFTLAEDPLEL